MCSLTEVKYLNSQNGENLAMSFRILHKCDCKDTIFLDTNKINLEENYGKDEKRQIIRGYGGIESL